MNSITIKNNKNGLKDYTGSIINNIKILKRIYHATIFSKTENRDKIIYKYKVRCLKCNKIFTRHKNSINNKLTCFCQKVLPNNAAAINSIYKEYKDGAKYRKLNFDINIELFSKLIKKNCSYCNCTPKTVKKTSTYNFKYNGIDRINNKKGYTKNNVTTCCIDCNKAKWMLTKNEFKKLITNIYNFYVKGLKE